MSEPKAEARHTLGSWVRVFFEVLGGLAALAGILAFFQGYKVLEKDRFSELSDLEDRYKRGEIIEKADCPKEEPAPLPVSDPLEDRTRILIAALDELIQEAGFLAKNVEEPGFFARFDQWRSNARDKLADSQKLIRKAGWTGTEDWVETFHSQTHIKRDMMREPYRPEELRGFLESGSKVLVGMRHEVILHSGKSIAPPAPPEISGLTPGG